MNNGELTTIERIREFILAGSATLTIRSTVSTQRFTYKIVKAESGTVYFVRLLRGPNNEDDFTFLGTLFQSRSEGDFAWVYRHSHKSRVSSIASSVVAFNYLMRVVTLASHVPKGLEVWHEGRCGRCNRKLTVPESVASGFGPECIGHIRQHPLQLENV